MAEHPHFLCPGQAEGLVLRLDEPLSLWGGLDAANGRIIDQHHPQVGVTVSGTMLVMPSGRGSSSASAVLLEAIRCGTAPAAIIMEHPDAIVALGAIVAAELYDVALPVVVVSPETLASYTTGDSLSL